MSLPFHPLDKDLFPNATLISFSLPEFVRAQVGLELGKYSGLPPVVEKRGRHLPPSRYLLEAVDKVSDRTFTLSRSKALLRISEYILDAAVVPLRADLFTGPARSVSSLHQDITYTVPYFSEPSLTVWCTIRADKPGRIKLHSLKGLDVTCQGMQAIHDVPISQSVALNTNMVLVTRGEQVYQAVFPVGCIVLAFRYRMSSYREGFCG